MKGDQTMTTKELNELKVFKRQIKKYTYGEALKAVMKRYSITVSELSENSIKDYRTIVAYRNGEVLPPKESVVQVCIGLRKVPLDIKFLLIESAGYNLNNAHEDIVYSMLLSNAESIDIEMCNVIIDDINDSELYKVNHVKRFKTITI